MTGEVRIESETLYTTIASFFYENAVAFNVADLPSYAALVDQCIELWSTLPRTQYKPLNRHRIGGPLLEPAYE